jgi:serine phosphatase RsbU (regulator of sigma subunit)
LLGIRKQGVEGWLVVPAVVPLAVSQFASELITVDLPVKWAPFGMTIFVGQISNLVSAAAVSLLLLRRLLLSVRRQRIMAFDMRQAQEVQQLMLPESRTTVPGLRIESEYRPALQVGGDFFQIIPHATDGAILIVAGDVAGKGLRAGMLVALLIGAIRTAARFDADPLTVLRALNDRLIWRRDALATCLALRIEADGTATLANAGHVPPYLNGIPVAMEGSLPLGMLDDAGFSVMRFKLEDDDRLMLMSDGIAEATDAHGNLFGFERVHRLLETACSAANVANIAEKFGQEDDITVISISRIAVAAPMVA